MQYLIYGYNINLDNFRFHYEDAHAVRELTLEKRTSRPNGTSTMNRLKNAIWSRDKEII